MPPVANARPPLVVHLPSAARLGPALIDALGGELAPIETRLFPDGETYLRVHADVSERTVFLVAALDRPDERLVPTLLAAATLRDLGASRIVLVAPYLPYLRQDDRFRAGEAFSARYVARLISREVDAVVTVDPHLHRLRSLDDIFDVPTHVVSAAPAIAEWIRTHVSDPIIVGPDEESAQWVEAVAALLDAPTLIFQKERSGDREVEVSGGGGADIGARTPVLLDDIVSSGMTLVRAARHLVGLGAVAAHCLTVHGLFADDALTLLRAAAGASVVSTNTVAHETNDIDIAPLLGRACANLVP